MSSREHSDDGDSDTPVSKKPNVFQFLNDEDSFSESEDEPLNNLEKEKASKPIEVKVDTPDETVAQKKANKKKKGKAQKKEHSDDEDLDLLLAEMNISSNANTNNAEESNVATEAAQDEVSSKTLKNRLKKEKKKQAKLQKREDQLEDTTEQKEEKQSTTKKPLSQAAKLAAEMQRRMKELEEKAKREEEERLRIEEEKRRKEEEEERERQLLLEKKRQQRKEKRERSKKEGKLLSAKEKATAMMNKKFLEQLGLDNVLEANSASKEQEPKRKSIAVQKKRKKAQQKEVVEEEESEHVESQPDTESEDSEAESIPDNWEELDDEVEPKATEPTKVVKPEVKKTKPVQEEQEDNVYDYRSPICCVLGHVDTGKTKLLDKIRHSNVQTAEAGGITQQIGATFFPKEMLDMHCHKINEKLGVNSPGLLIIDTPGHESFNNLRARGSSLCDIAILVVDIMHGLEPQTIESIGLLKARKCYFVIALNKIDRIYQWEATPWATFKSTFEKQKSDSKAEFNERAKNIMLELSENGLNSSLYWENDNIKKNVSICPTSAITGEGIPDLLALVVQLTQLLMTKKLTYTDCLRCSVLEVKTIEGLGTTVDVILLDGVLREGDKIVLCGLSGPIVTTIRTLLTPQPLAELRVKGEYIHHSSIKAAMGVKIVAPGLEDAVAGTELLVVGEEDDVDELCNDVMKDMSTIFDSVDRTGIGVYVMASTLGSLEALLQFLSDKNIRVFAVNIGPVQKKDVKKASIMREKGHPEYSVILAFDIKIAPEAEKEAEVLGVKIMTADIIYHLLDSFLKYMEEQQEQKKQSQSANVVFPCELTILPTCIFNKKDPFVFGVHVDNGILKTGTPLVAITKGTQLMIGRVASLEHNKKSVDKAIKGQEICIKVVGEPTIAYGRHFDHTAKLYSKITRDSIDVLKEYFRDDMSKDAWKLTAQLKKVFNIV
ncbi:translation initiation factor if-2, putative [Theileria equi strain WA]|uniref:Eukaryotic translation initiation factor 5B n=1 Tax=Theileria equi strain WA TaxID=1537102 RepID=L0ATS7_THEEQ|nr:translation initiation factor if-2, putative [Theileria equi strain WA]AFZ79052.1 translation initiation factor if-2, putative [Theileria equi strain WA]|eukprot:XP_004828718.1 translation initiation factor if-2, putative [Theileria equi strain WA]